MFAVDLDYDEAITMIQFALHTVHLRNYALPSAALLLSALAARST